MPQVLAVSDDELRYLQKDLGSVSLFDAIRGGREAGGRYTLKEQELLRQTIRELPNIQIRGARGLDFSHCYPQPAFDRDSVLFDLNYFKYCFLKATELDFHELKLEADFRLLAKDLTAGRRRAVLPLSRLPGTQRHVGRGRALLHRLPRRAARTLLLRPGVIPVAGVGTLFPQATPRAGLRLLQRPEAVYRGALEPHKFVERLSLFVLFRQLQVLGAYGFRGYFERKQHFIDSIPPAMQNLRELLSTDRVSPIPT